MKKTITLLTAAVLLAPMPAVFAQNMAIVNGKPISQARFNAALKTLQEQAQRSGTPLPPDIENRVREHLIQQEVIVQQAENLKLNLTSEYAQKMQELRVGVLTDMLYQQYQKDNPITDKKLKAAYDQYIANLPPPKPNTREYHVRHILLKTEKEARKVHEQLSKKGASFERLAKRYSIDRPSARNGGSLGWSEASAYVPPFARTVRRLQKGQTAKTIVKTQFGYHIIKLEDSRLPEPPTFEQVKEQIRQPMLRQQRQEFNLYLQELKNKARIR